MSVHWSHPALRSTLVTTLSLLAVVAHQLGAQNLPTSRAIAVVAGPANYDLSGTGWSWSAGAKLDLPIGRMLILEPSLGFFTYDSQFGTRSSMLLPEVSLQLQYPGARVRPYIGVGTGVAFVVQGTGFTDPSVHAAIGLRAPIRAGWGLRGEARVRNVTVFEANASMLEFVAGLSRAW